MLNTIKSKIILFISLLLLSSILSLLFVAVWSINRSSTADLENSFSRINFVIESQLRNYKINLGQQVELIGRIPALRAVVETGDFDTIVDKLQTYKERFGLDLQNVFNKKGNLIASLNDDLVDINLFQKYVNKFFSSDEFDNFQAQLHFLKNKMAIISMVIIGSSFDISGVMLSGNYLDEKFLSEIKKITGADISIVREKKIISSTLSSDRVYEFQKNIQESKGTEVRLKKYKTRFLDIMALSDEKIGEFSIHLPLSHLEKTKIKITQFVMFIGFLLLIIAVIVGYFISKSLSDPIVNLNKLITEIVEKNNLSLQAEVTGDDETAGLAKSFNRLTNSLRDKTVSKDYVDNILNSMNEILIVIDSEGNVETTNNAATHFLGYTVEELKSKKIYEFMVADFLPDNKFNLDDLIKSGLDLIQDKDVTLYSKDNEEIPFSITGGVLKENDQVKGMILTCKDMRDSQLLKKLRTTQKQLVQSAKLASLGEMSAGVAHELKNPLAIIEGFNNRLKINLSKENIFSSDKAKRYVQLIEENCHRISTIITHMQEFSRQAGHKFRPIDVNEVVDKSFILFSEQFRLNNIAFEKQLTEGSLKSFGDPTKLEQIFVNLLSNARDSITDFKERREGKVIVTTKLVEKNIIVEVSDNGPGIPEDVIDKIFDPFYTTKEVGKGTGLGLSISYGIIKEHKGNITCKSEIGVGTTFIISLPQKNGEESLKEKS